MASNQSKVRKYKLNMNASGEWEVLKFGKIIKTFSHQEAYNEACDYVQRCVENDRWHASNRD